MQDQLKRAVVALAWRLHRGSLVAWSAAFAFFGAVLGAAAKAASDALGQNKQIMEFLPRIGGTAGVGDVFIGGVLSILGIAVWVLAGLAVALFGLVPRLVTAAWVALGVFLLLGQVGAPPGRGLMAIS